MHNFEVYSNESPCRKSGCLGMDQVSVRENREVPQKIRIETMRYEKGTRAHTRDGWSWGVWGIWGFRGRDIYDHLLHGYVTPCCTEGRSGGAGGIDQMKGNRVINRPARWLYWWPAGWLCQVYMISPISGGPRVSSWQGAKLPDSHHSRRL